jgi:hypothetical protein
MAQEPTMFTSGTTKKFSIGSIVAPQQSKVTVANDINTLVNSVSNFGKVLADEKTKQTYLEHDEALQYNRKALQDDLYNAGDDLESINEAYAQWEARGKAIISSGALSQEGRITLGKSFQMHREMFGGTIRKVNQELKAEKFKEDFVSSVPTMMSLPKEDLKDSWRAYLSKAKEDKLDVNTTAEFMFKSMSKVFAEQLSEVGLNATPFELKEMIDSYEANMLSLDKKLENKEYFNKTMGFLKDSFLAPSINAYTENIKAQLKSGNLSIDGYLGEVAKLEGMVNSTKLATLKEQAVMQDRENKEQSYARTLQIAMRYGASLDDLVRNAEGAGWNDEEIKYLRESFKTDQAKAQGEATIQLLKQGIEQAKFEIQNGQFTGDPQGLAQAIQKTKDVLTASDMNYILRADFQSKMIADPELTFSKDKSEFPESVQSDYDKGAERYANVILSDFAKDPSMVNLQRYLSHVQKTGKGGNNTSFIGDMLSTENFKATKTAPNSEEYLQAQGQLASNLGLMGQMIATITTTDPLLVDKVFNKKQIQRYEGLQALMDMGELTPPMIDRLDSLLANPQDVESLPQKDSRKLLETLADNGVMPDEYSSYMKQAKIMYTLTGDSNKYLDSVKTKLSNSGVYGDGKFVIKGARDTDGSPLVMSKADEKTVNNMLKIIRGDVTDFRDFLKTNRAFQEVGLVPDAMVRGVQNIKEFLETKGKGDDRYSIEASYDGENLVGLVEDAVGFRYDQQTKGIFLTDKEGLDIYFLDMSPREFISFSSKVIENARYDALNKVFSFEGSMQKIYDTFMDAMSPEMTAEERAEYMRNIATKGRK